MLGDIVSDGMLEYFVLGDIVSDGMLDGFVSDEMLEDIVSDGIVITGSIAGMPLDVWNCTVAVLSLLVMPSDVWSVRWAVLWGYRRESRERELCLQDWLRRLAGGGTL